MTVRGNAWMLTLLRGHRMSGGLYFGPAGWIPDAWTPLPASAARFIVALPPGVVPPDGWPHQAAPIQRGQIIMAGPTAAHPDVLAPCSGLLQTVADIDDAAGGLGRGVLLTASPDAPIAPALPAPAPHTLAELRECLKRGGIGPCSSRVPSLLAQLTDLGDAAPTLLLVNLMPQLPESRLTWALAQFQAQRLFAGLSWLRSVLHAPRALAVVDRADWPAIRRWRRDFRSLRIPIRHRLNYYPQGDPTVLLWTLLGRRLPVGALPTRVGVLMVDAVTLWALGGLARDGFDSGALTRPIELFVAGQSPQLVEAPLGLPISDLLRALNVSYSGRQCIVNGMLAGVEVDPESAVVQGTTAAISIRNVPELEKPAPCFACGWCVDHCPTALNPLQLYRLALSRDGAKTADAEEALNCISCGLCSYVCPTRLPLTQEVVGLRGAVRRQWHERFHLPQKNASPGGRA